MSQRRRRPRASRRASSPPRSRRGTRRPKRSASSSGQPALRREERVVANILHRLFRILEIHVQFRIQPATQRQDDRVHVVLWGADMQLFTRPEVQERLEALKLLLQLMASHQLGGRQIEVEFHIDEDATRAAEAIKTQAEATADEVWRTGQPQALPPMNAADRRVVHIALHRDSRVETRSQGEEPNRRVVIYPRQPWFPPSEETELPRSDAETDKATSDADSDAPETPDA
ncbi:MAG: hypothetical protein GXO36_02360 [Chloroflexi bacterium]|nr:hypothetical protein [Chloroflexota bacterium]